MEILISFIIPFIILLTIVVFIHEYGHYYFAKKYGVGVTDFSIGFGKEIFGFNDKSGTRWKFCAIPLGGYVKFFGDRNVFSQAEQEELLKEYNEKDREKLKNDTLKGILIDMETDIYQYNLALDILKYRLIQADSLILGYYDDNRINQVRNYWGFQGQKISMNSLVNTGAIEYIKNPELIRELSFHYDFHYDNMRDNSNAFENLFIRLMDYLNNNYEVEGMDNLDIEDLDNIGKTFGSTYYKFSDKEINKMKNDIWLKNHMYNYKLILRLYLSGYTTGLDRIMKINELIVKEINN